MPSRNVLKLDILQGTSSQNLQRYWWLIVVGMVLTSAFLIAALRRRKRG